jgi:hypothetical protein
VGRAAVLLNAINRPSPRGLTGGNVVESSPERRLRARRALECRALMGSGIQLSYGRYEVGAPLSDGDERLACR